MVLWILFDRITLITDDIQRVPPQEIKNTFRALEEFYRSEEDESLLLSIDFSTCSRMLHNCLTFTQDSFIKTLSILPDDAKLSRQIVKQYRSGGKDVLDSETFEFERFIPAAPKFGIEINSNFDQKLEMYGYIPSIRIDSLDQEGEGDFQDIFSRIGLVGELDSNWRISAYIYHRHRVSSEEELRKRIKAKTPKVDRSEFIELAKNPVYDFSLTLEYIAKDSNSIIDDIEEAILYVIKNGWRKEIAMNRLRIYDQETQKPRMWNYLKPLWLEYDRRRAQHINRLAAEKKLLFANMIGNPVIIGKAKLFDVYNNLEVKPMYISRKLDGQRAIIVIDISIDQSTLTRNKTIFGKVNFTTFSAVHTSDYSYQITKKDLAEFKKNKIAIAGFSNIITIFDSEYYKGTYYIFDVLSFIGDKCVVKSYQERLERLKLPAFAVMRRLAQHVKLQLAVKKAVPLTKENFTDELLKLFETEHKGIKYDGVILTTNNAPAFEYVTYKVKPAELNSVDFLLKRIDQQYLLAYDIKPQPNKICHVAYVSYRKRAAETGIRPLIRDNPWFTEHFSNLSNLAPEDRMPIPFATAICSTSHLVWADEDYSDTIVECIWREDHWEPFQTRADKTLEYKTGIGMYGNTYIVAFITFATLLDRITPETIREISKQGAYFQEVPAQIKAQYEDFLRFSRLSKAILYEKYVKPAVEDTIVEVAAGRFSDIHRILHTGARNVYITDGDLSALLEAEERAIQQMQSPIKNALANPIEGIRTDKRLQMNLLSTLFKIGEDDPKIAAERILNDEYFPQDLSTVISMQFAIHYVCDESFDGLKQFINRLLRKNGIFAVTFYDGDAILSMLRSKSVKGVYSTDGKTLKFYHGLSSNNVGDVKYTIEAMFDAKKVTKITPGLKVKITIPTISLKPSTENLVSTELIRKLLGNEYSVQVSARFIDLPEITEQYRKLIGSVSDVNIKTILAEEDAAYVSLIKFAVFKRKAAKKWKRA